MVGDLNVGQWVKAYWAGDPSDPKRQKVVKIEPGMAPWAAQRLADLSTNAAALDVSVRASTNGKGNHEELHLIGPEHPGGYKEPFFVRLSKGEMTGLLRVLAVEGFLADAFDTKTINAQPQPPAPP